MRCRGIRVQLEGTARGSTEPQRRRDGAAGLALTHPDAFVCSDIPAARRIHGHRFTVAALDLGIKTNTPRNFAERGIRSHILPSSATFEQIAEIKSRLQRTNPVDEADVYLELFGDLVPLEQYRIALREKAMGAVT